MGRCIPDRSDSCEYTSTSDASSAVPPVMTRTRTPIVSCSQSRTAGYDSEWTDNSLSNYSTVPQRTRVHRTTGASSNKAGRTRRKPVPHPSSSRPKRKEPALVSRLLSLLRIDSANISLTVCFLICTADGHRNLLCSTKKAYL